MRTVQAFIEEYFFWLSLPSLSVIDIAEIVILAILLYFILRWIKDTRAWVLLKGILIIVIFTLVASIFQMDTILWLVNNAISVGIIAVVIVFQPELRKALEELGRKQLISSAQIFGSQKDMEKRFSDKTISEIVRACFSMGKVRTGALIVIERIESLREYISTGIEIDGVISGSLLINIFEHNTPLHDGAVIMRGDRILAATCYLPLTENRDLSKELGTRHRAAVGISEISDALVIVVSEETGEVSIALAGQIIRNVDGDFLRNKLYEIQKRNTEAPKSKRKRGRRANGNG